MPDSRHATIMKTYKSAFVSPFTDMPPVAFYSSIVIPRAQDAGDCLSCALRGITRSDLAVFLEQLAANQANSLLLPPDLSETIPILPPQPTP